MRTDLEIYEPLHGTCVIIGPETPFDHGFRRALVPPMVHGLYHPRMSREEAEIILERLQQLEACSLLDLDHYARPATWGTTIRMPVAFAEMEKV